MIQLKCPNYFWPGLSSLKEICEEFPAGNASRYFVIRFRVNDGHFVSGNLTELFYVNLD